MYFFCEEPTPTPTPPPPSRPTGRKRCTTQQPDVVPWDHGTTGENVRTFDERSVKERPLTRRVEVIDTKEEEPVVRGGRGKNVPNVNYGTHHNIYDTTIPKSRAWSPEGRFKTRYCDSYDILHPNTTPAPDEDVVTGHRRRAFTPKATNTRRPQPGAHRHLTRTPNLLHTDVGPPFTIPPPGLEGHRKNRHANQHTSRLW
eukprot:TRINITY_DN519_c0_g1_i1.p1 TRINITY_DN519_c0_g1~~TRINITY_DN519_c0_g1_i1.p1  ORF type:complete len:200 (+),score=25.91 TRINITY_DN519_c0_g1_i1:58-657(+)